MTDEPTHVLLYRVAGVEHLYRVAFGMLDFNDAQRAARLDGYEVYALPYATYLRREAVGS